MLLYVVQHQHVATNPLVATRGGRHIRRVRVQFVRNEIFNAPSACIMARTTCRTRPNTCADTNRKRAEHESEVSVPRVFHFVSTEDMYFIDRQWYDCFMPDDDRCLSPALPEDQVHIVVTVHNFLASSVLEWVETLGFSRVSVFLYYREPREIRNDFTGRCRIKVYERVLTPNVGHEAAPYLAHNPPELMLFAHHHRPNAWHASSESFVRRARAYYRGLTSAGSAMEREFASLHVSLSKCDDKDGKQSI